MQSTLKKKVQTTYQLRYYRDSAKWENNHSMRQIVRCWTSSLERSTERRWQLFAFSSTYNFTKILYNVNFSFDLSLLKFDFILLDSCEFHESFVLERSYKDWSCMRWDFRNQVSLTFMRFFLRSTANMIRQWNITICQIRAKNFIDHISIWLLKDVRSDWSHDQRDIYCCQ